MDTPGAVQRWSVVIDGDHDRQVEVRARKGDLKEAYASLQVSFGALNDKQIREMLQEHCNQLRRTVDADALMDRDDEVEYDWAVPGMLEHEDRVILTGGEGQGKSTLIRQWLIQISCGIHPLTNEDIDPVPVLLVDLENSERQLKRELRRLREIAGDRWVPGMRRVFAKNAGWDLLDTDNQEMLLETAEATRASVIGIGPLYKATTKDLSDEATSRELSGFLDALRTTDYHPALLIEAHSPNAPGMGRRPPRPYGSSLWQRWPEFGLILGDEGALRHWRGARDAEREWPAFLHREGNKWLWTPVGEDTVTGTKFRQKELQAIADELGRKPSVREAAKRMGLPRETARRALTDFVWTTPKRAV